MASNSNAAHKHRVAIIGNDTNFWLYDSEKGFDLTHPAKPSSPPILPRVAISTTTSPVIVDPAKTALVIIDMQNFFLSPALGRTRGPGHEAAETLAQHAIPAARKAGIRVIWLNWGLTRKEIDEMPPATVRAFGYVGEMAGEQVVLDKYGDVKLKVGEESKEDGKPGKKSRPLGGACGIAPDPISGKDVDVGNFFMRDQWNTALYDPLDRLYEEGKKLTTRPDVWIHKNRMSGMWGSKTLCEEFLEREGIRTLMFAGVNTDQCVGGTLTDSYSKGYDCILLSDGCGTTSPEFAQKCMEHNASNTWGFTTTCKDLADGVNAMGE